MKYSDLFGKTTRNVPKDEVSANAELLTKAGFIYKVMAGVYAYTPLGLMVLDNIKQIVRQEMNAIGGQELIMSSLQPKAVWEETGRWDDKVVDVWFKSKLKDGSEVGLAWSHEEAIMDMVKQSLSSYQDLPIYVYQFQTKLRNELRAKSGIMRGREFVMKDMYSLSASAEAHEAFYQSAIEAYKRVFDRLGIGQDTYVTFASGGAFTKFSHEFQTICEAGEDVIYLHRGKNIAVNEEVLDDDNLAELGIKRDELEKVNSAEVGNIFNFGTDKSQTMDVAFTDANGQRQYVHLGSYGIGITRLMGVLVEKFHDDRGIIWPQSVAPALVYLASLGQDQDVLDAAAQLYEQLQQQGIKVIWDERNVSAGVKLADADVIGLPYRVVVSRKSLDQHGFELKPRSGEPQLVDVELLIKQLKA